MRIKVFKEWCLYYEICVLDTGDKGEREKSRRTSMRGVLKVNILQMRYQLVSRERKLCSPEGR